MSQSSLHSAKCPQLTAWTPTRTPFSGGSPLITSIQSLRPKSRSWNRATTSATYTVDKEQATLTTPPETMPKVTPEVLDWNKQWYPVHAVRDLDPTKPHPVTLLGKDIVLWSSNGEWKAFVDLCPHRKVPLSEGRVHNNTLECAYHGWEFDGSGKLVVIPQVGHSDKQAEQKACNNSRACVSAFPTQVQQGLVWVWADCSPQAYVESTMQGPALSPEYGRFEGKDWAWTYEHYVRDVPGSFEFWMENMMDQSHVAYSHSGVAGNRHFKDDAELFQYMGVDKRSEPQDGFEFSYKVNFGNALNAQKVEFRPPALCRFSSDFSKKSGFSLWIYAVPTGNNSTRLIINAGLSPKAFGASAPSQAKSPISAAKTAAVRAFSKSKPRWQSHMQLSGVSDGDIVFLHRQSSYAKQHSAGRPMQNYFLPSSSDRGVSAWYEWLVNRGDKGPKYEGDTEPALFRNGMGVLDRKAMLDRTNHVRNCSSCTKALKQVQTGQEITQVASVASALGTAYYLGQGTDLVSLPVAATLLLAAALLVANKKLQDLEKRFAFLDWQHSEH